MMRICLVAVIVLAGCNTPMPAFYGVEAERVTVGQSTFDVRIKENRANAIRINREFAPTLAAVAPRAVAAINQVSGCEVIPGSVSGDQASINARLKC